MWTKGNHRGEWEVYSDGIMSGDKHDVVTPKSSDVHECASCANESFSVSNPYIELERYDARLIELAPRMAEALIDFMYGTGTGIDIDLIDELRRMKHGDK